MGWRYLILALALPATAAPLPDWLVQQSIATSEQEKHELKIDCVQIIRYRKGVGTCITMPQWCRMHRAMGQPVDDIAVCRHEPLFGRYGP